MKYWRYILTLGVILLVGYFTIHSPKYSDRVKDNSLSGTKSISDIKKEKKNLCYIWNTEAGDSTSLRINLSGIDSRHVTGSLDFYPKEKDSKIGSFTGTVETYKGDSLSRKASLMWQAGGEGITNTEELSVIFGEGIATIGFGEMRDNGKGVYVYADPKSISYEYNLQETDCTDSALR